MSEGNKEKRKIKPIIAPRIQFAEQVRHLYRVTLEEGQTLEDVLEPETWSHIAVQLQQFDRIEVVEETGAFYAELLVASCDRTSASVTVLVHKELAPSEVAEREADVYPKWRGPIHKWCAIRKSDGAVLKSEMQDKGEALNYITGIKLAA